MHPIVNSITQEIARRSAPTRERYLALMARQRKERIARVSLSPANQAHGYAALPNDQKILIRSEPVPMLAIVSAYNDVLSAHQPFEHYPAIIKDEARKVAAIAHFAGGVPAMCDGVTQGQPGMDLSLFSRDLIAMSTAIALTHDLYDGVALLGICDKIVPGMLIGALSFGHLPCIFIPAGPMPTGISNSEKSRVRKLHAQGKASDSELLVTEMAAYHSEGTCTFYGTANSNQALLEAMGLMLPGSAFEQPHGPMRESLTRAATRQLAEMTKRQQSPLGELVNEFSLVNAIVALLATGGSTNHTMHWVAIAQAAGFTLTWDDIDALSRVVPTLARVYPNGDADVNDFHEAGGIGLVMRELLDGGLMHGNVKTVVGDSLYDYTRRLENSGPQLRYSDLPLQSPDTTIIGNVSKPFNAEGGLRLLKGNLGNAIVKVSAVAPEHRVVSAPARVFNSQDAVIAAFKSNQFTSDCVIVVRGQGPMACGMPELHKLTPSLTVLLDRGLKVALVTDGRMSGASGKVPAAIHVTPEAARGGLLAKLSDGDLITVDCVNGILSVANVDADFINRPDIAIDSSTQGWGRELFGGMRALVSTADTGASVFGK